MSEHPSFSSLFPDERIDQVVQGTLLSDGLSLAGTVDYHYGVVKNDYYYWENEEDIPPVSSLGLYHGGIKGLGAGPGLILSTGSAEPGSGSGSLALSHSFYRYQYSEGAGDLSGVAYGDMTNPTEDVTRLSIPVWIDDPGVRSLALNFVFATEEYPDFSSTEYFDYAALSVNGHQYLNAHQYFSDPANHSLMRDNREDLLPVEYDGVSEVINLSVPVNPGLNTIELVVVDALDTRKDTALIVSDISAQHAEAIGFQSLLEIDTSTGSVQDMAGNQQYTLPETFFGELSFNPVQTGQDNVVHQNGLLRAEFSVSLSDLQYHENPDKDEIHLVTEFGQTSFQGLDHLQVEDAYVILDTSPGDYSYEMFALHQRLLGYFPEAEAVAYWTQFAMNAQLETWQLADHMIDTFMPDVSREGLIQHLYEQTFGQEADETSLTAYKEALDNGFYRSEGDLLLQSLSLGDIQSEFDQAGLNSRFWVLDSAAFV